jgi:DNA repair protein RadA/Sms
LVRWKTGLDEFDFVLGGGIVPGSMTLVGGEPGIGKSTLLLQARRDWKPPAYRSSTSVARNLPISCGSAPTGSPKTAGPSTYGGNPLDAILMAAAALPAQILILDSIQTVYTETLEGAPGNVGQVREVRRPADALRQGDRIAVITVGHVTKGGGLAGPKTLEHIVDTVLYFEGEGVHDYRLLRATKNRFGSVDELGVFSMTERGLLAVQNPSALFLSARAVDTSGSAVTALMEGTRPVLVEVQALAAHSGFGTPQRVATGWTRSGSPCCWRSWSGAVGPRSPISMSSSR